MATYLGSLMVVLQPANLIALLGCSVIGCILGAIPGLGGATGMTLLLPMTFAMSTELSFCMLLGIYVGGISGSFIAAILVGIPGTASSVSTTFDGYPMTKKGKAAKALSIAITASFIGTVLSIIVATVCSKWIADFALMLGPWEYFSLCFMAISLVVSLSHGSIYKGLVGAFFGVWLATIGADKITNQMRFTFDNYNLFGGFSVICLLMGTFGIQMILTSFARGEKAMPEVDGSSLKGFGLGLKDFILNIKTILVSFLIGLWIGFLPGMGGGVSNMISYGQAKRMSKHPEEFGKGAEAGLWASEVANNASVGGALIPMVSLGIPGDGSAVLLLSAMTIHGLQAGPMFISSEPKLAYLIFSAVLVSAILIFIVEMLTKRWFPLLLKAPYHYLYGAILMICFLGAFSATSTMFSVGLMIIFGIIGILFEYCEIPMSPMMLAYILGGNLENYFRSGCSYAKGDMTMFFTRPISCILLLIGVYSLFKPLLKIAMRKLRPQKETL